jgi:putative nucleotidyltransferase with HDIG domain
MLTRSAQQFGAFTQRDASRLLIAATVLIVTLGGILAADALPTPFTGPPAVAGDVATADIIAPRTAIFESQVATEQRREEVRNQVPPQYDYTPERGLATAEQQERALEQAVAPIDAAFEAVLSPEARIAALRAALPDLSTSARETLAGLDQVEWTALRGEMLRVLESTQRQEVRDALLPEARGSLSNRIAVRFDADQRAMATEILSPLLIPNSTFDAAATDRAKQEAANRVNPVRITIRQGEIIVRRGQQLDETGRERLQLFGLLDPRPDPARAAAWVVLAALLVGLLLGWLWRFRPQLWHRNNALILIGLVLVGATVALKVTADRSVVPFILPTAAVGLLLAILLDSTAALVVTALLAVLGAAVIGTVEFGTYLFLGGLAGIIVIRRGERLSHFVQAAVIIAIVNLAVVTLFTPLFGERDLTGLFQLWVAAMLAAAGSAVAAVGTFSALGNLFGITTSFQLLELANPSQPLLRRLLLETPGTYHHSLMVGNLGERAAEAIGADPLLTRVAAYYHDIGKLENPLAYIENQAGTENIHDELTPEQSVALLKSHVASGIDLAYRFKLPKAIIPFIPQHHGTALMSYFHARAKARAAADAGAPPDTPQAAAAAQATVDAGRFRHAGPKPQSKEAAILMLADGVEASVRSLTAQDEPTIRAMVARIIRERLEDGQFDECDLTLRDLEKIREAFVAQLLGMYHRRIEYPQNKIVELESRRSVG